MIKGQENTSYFILCTSTQCHFSGLSKQDLNQVLFGIVPQCPDYNMEPMLGRSQ